MTTAALTYLETNHDRFLVDLFELLRIPSISSSPDHREDVKRCADWLADHMRSLGLENVQVMPTPGHPVVYGDWLHAAERPTVLVYNHYDVQPVDPLDEWESPPFEPTIRAGRLYARGSADDKGQLFVHLKAVEAVLNSKGALPVNLKFLYEGEEESGSVHLDDFIEEHKAMLAADLVVISDTAMFAPGMPSICYGLRGGDSPAEALSALREAPLHAAARRPSVHHADRPSGRTRRDAGAGAGFRDSSGLHTLGRLHTCCGEFRIAAQPADLADRLRPSG